MHRSSLLSVVCVFAAAACGTPDDGGTDPVAPLRIGVAVVDITPQGFETWTDTDGNGDFNGCLDLNTVKDKSKCKDPFDDKDKDGKFDCVFIAGFGSKRPATGVHDPIEARAVVIRRGSQKLALVSLDLIGLGANRIDPARAELAKKGWNPDRIVVSSSHTHQGPDVRGMWGSFAQGDGSISGADPVYNASLAPAIVEAVTKAEAALTEVESVRMGAVRMRDRSEYFNGPWFGGKNPTDKMHGLINDSRDPVLVSDQVFAMQVKAKGGQGLLTLVSFSSHPEVVGSSNTLLSADYVYYLRQRLEERLGGRAVFLAESLGGMQGTLGGDVPEVDDKGAWKWEGEGDKKQPVWAKHETFEYARSLGIHVADATEAALEGGKQVSLAQVAITSRLVYVPIDNIMFQIGIGAGIFDTGNMNMVKDKALCPEWIAGSDVPGCLPVRMQRIVLGPLDMLTVPGELLPEIFWGFPAEDPRWAMEAADARQRGQRQGYQAVYFPQHPPECDETPYAKCREELDIGKCNCLKMHDVPYAISLDPAMKPLRELMKGSFRLIIGNGNDHFGYIVPMNDFNKAVSGLTEDGDHYEETVSLSWQMAGIVQKAAMALLE